MKLPESQKQDRRKFEAELPNDIWQSDVMHGPMVTEGDRKRKSYLIAFIDDHSRLIPYARFYLSCSPNLSTCGFVPLKADLGLIVFVSLNPAVDVQIHRCNISIAFLLPSDLNAIWAVLMVK